MKQKEVNNLRKAIDLAEKPSGCKYVVDGKPCCVIAQLAVLEGIPVEDISKWDRQNSCGIGVLPLTNGVDVLVRKYPREVLVNMQGAWDRAFDIDAKESIGMSYYSSVSSDLSSEDMIKLEKYARVCMNEMVSKELEKPEYHSF